MSVAVGNDLPNVERVQADPRFADAARLYWQLHELATLTRRSVDRQLAEINTSSDQILALRTLLAEEQLTVGGLAQSTGLERNSASQLVERLVARGLVERSWSRDDRRKTWISITANGRELVALAEKRTAEVAARLVAPLSNEQLVAGAATLALLLQQSGDPNWL